MAFYTMVIYVGVTIASVLYSGALALRTIFDLDLTKSIWAIGAVAALYTIWGGLKAVAWADLFQGSALILGGIVVMVLGFVAVGGVPEFLKANGDKLHMILPKDHPVLPWTALVIGLWIPNLYYWGLNQFISQRSLAAKSLKHGQLGIISKHGADAGEHRTASRPQALHVSASCSTGYPLALTVGHSRAAISRHRHL